MVDSKIIDVLLNKNFQKDVFVEKWLLFGVSEGHMSGTLDAIAKPFECSTGYRLWYPYLEFKIYSKNAEEFANLKKEINQLVKEHIVEDGKTPASDLLKKAITNCSHNFSFDDKATGGLLQSTIETPNTCSKLNFNKENGKDIHIEVLGLQEFWDNIIDNFTHIDINIFTGNKKFEFSKKIPYRGMRVKLYAVELTSKIIYEKLKELDVF